MYLIKTCLITSLRYFQNAHFILIVGVGKERRTRYIIWSMMTCKGSTRSWNYLENYWPCAGKLSAVTAIDTQLNYPIKSGLARWRMAVQRNGCRHRNQEEPREEAPDSAQVLRMSRLARDRTDDFVSQDQILGGERGQGNIIFSCSADHEQDWQPYPVDPYSAICDDHTYHNYFFVLFGGLKHRNTSHWGMLRRSGCVQIFL